MTRSPEGSQARIRLGDLLVKAGVLSESQLRTALQEQAKWGGKLGDTLVRMRYLTEDVFVRALSKQLRLERADLTRPIPLDALAKLPAALAEEYEVVPLAMADGGRSLVVATADPLNITVLDAIRAVTQMRVTAQVAGASQIRSAIARLYRSDEVPEVEDDTPMEMVRNAADVLPVQRAIPVQPSHTPVFGVPVAQMTGAFRTPPPYETSPMFPAAKVAAPPVERAPTAEESQRQVAALKALVELLVQKGVISLDEYLARLRKD